MNFNDIFRGADVFTELTSLETLDDVEVWLKALLRRVIRYRNEHDLEGKNLPADSDRTLPEIASFIGYANAQSFTRYFRKYEGITPGRYRTLPLRRR